MDYIKIPVICIDAIMALTGPERGRLLGSLLRYIQGIQGSEEGAEEPRGNEYSLFLVLKAQIDKDRKDRDDAAKRKRKSREVHSVTESVVTSCDIAGHRVTLCDPPSSLSSPPTPPLSISPTPKEKPPKGGKEKGPMRRPTVEEVGEYCRAHGYRVDPQTFVDFYASKGWMVGKSPMKDWQAAVRTWERKKAQEGGTSSGSERLVTLADLQRR